MFWKCSCYCFIFSFSILNFVKSSSFTLSDIITCYNACCVSACFQPIMFKYWNPKPECVLVLHHSPSNGNILNVFGIVLGTFPTVYWLNVRSLLESRVNTVGLSRSLAAQCEFLMTKAEEKRKGHLSFLFKTFVLPSGTVRVQDFCRKVTIWDGRVKL